MTILEVRKKAKMKQVTLARIIGITPVQLCNIEKGRNKPHPKTIEKIEDYFRMHLDEGLTIKN